MYPYIHIGSFQLGTFGILLWLAAVAGIFVMQKTFTRDGVDADALNIVALAVILGVIGAKTWHELQDPAELAVQMQRIGAPGWSHPWQVVLGFLHWFQAGFAWFGGLLAAIAMLLYQGVKARPNGLRGLRAGVRMLDLSAPAAAVGYGVGRIGCLTSGDGDYGKNTTSTLWGVHMRPDALVPPHPANALVLATPIWELAGGLLIGLILWQLGKRMHPLGFLTGMYLLLSGLARFTVEFWRINPPEYFGMSNAQTAAVISVLVGAGIVLAVRKGPLVGGPAAMPVKVEEAAV